MKKVIAIGGVPATGKTTLMRRVIDEFGPLSALEEKVDGVKLPMLVDQERKLHILGVYNPEEMFAGTDRLSMSIQPTAVKFVESTEGVVLFEGDRLFNISFLETCEKLADLSIICLDVDPEMVEQRHTDRADSQSEKFKKGRQTKVDNVKARFGGGLFDDGCVESMLNNTIEQQDKVVARLKDLVYGNR